MKMKLLSGVIAIVSGVQLSMLTALIIVSSTSSGDSFLGFLGLLFGLILNKNTISCFYAGLTILINVYKDNF